MAKMYGLSRLRKGARMNIATLADGLMMAEG